MVSDSIRQSEFWGPFEGGRHCLANKKKMQIHSLVNTLFWTSIEMFEICRPSRPFKVLAEPYRETYGETGRALRAVRRLADVRVQYIKERDQQKRIRSLLNLQWNRSRECALWLKRNAGEGAKSQRKVWASLQSLEAFCQERRSSWGCNEQSDEESAASEGFDWKYSFNGVKSKVFSKYPWNIRTCCLPSNRNNNPTQILTQIPKSDSDPVPSRSWH